MAQERMSKEKVKQILLLKERGLTIKDIANQLSISGTTVRNYLKPSYLKKNNEVERDLKEAREIIHFNEIMRLMRVTA